MEEVSSPRSSTAESLVGRSDDLARLRTFLTEAAVRGGTLLLAGDPGVGKTVLLDAAAEIATAAGSAVLRASGVEFEAEVSFSVLNQLLSPLRGALDGLAEAERAALSVALGYEDGPAPDRFLVAAALVSVLRAAAAARPVLVIVDDVHWADRSSAAVLGFLGRSRAAARVGLLAAFRTDAGTFFDRDGLPEHELAPLGEEAAARLIGTRFPLLPGRARQRVLTEAAGNPLALLELPTALSGPQLASLRGLPPVMPLTERLRALFASRVAQLPAGTRELLLLAALGGTGDRDVLRAAASHGGITAHLAPARQARLVDVHQGSGQLTFRHPMVRATVVELATARERRRAHRCLAEVLAGQPDLQIWHLAEAATGPDEELAKLLGQAADRAVRRGDATGAVTALIRAADLSPESHDRARRLAEAAYLAADVTGDLRGAAELLSGAARAGPAADSSLQGAVTAAFVELHGEGNVDSAHRLLVAALDSHAADGDAADPAFIEALHNLLEVCLYGARPELWGPFEVNVSRLAPGAAPVLSLWSHLLADPVRTAAGWLGRLSSAIEGLRDETDPTRIERIAAAGIYVDQVSACRQPLWRVVREGRDGGAITSAINAMTLLCLDGFMTGRWAEARRLAREGTGLCEARGYQLLAWPLRLTTALLAAAQGDDAVVRALTEAMAQWAIPRGAGAVQGYACHARALAALGRNDFEEAYQQAAAISPPGVFAAHVGQALWVSLDLVEAAVRTNRQAEAAAHVAAMHEARVAQLSPRLALLASGCAALAAPDGDFTAPFARALALPGAERWPFDLARVRLAYGERLRRAQATTEARVHLTAALDAFTRLDARPWVTRARTELLATSPTKSQVGGFGLAGLTPQEREVAMLAGSGLTNKQIAQRLFISPRTVGAHLRQVFLKLAITSRAGIGDALAAADAQQPGSRLEVVQDSGHARR
jgi:DNA-binding CsgD family transcriptional regulator